MILKTVCTLRHVSALDSMLLAELPQPQIKNQEHRFDFESIHYISRLLQCCYSQKIFGKLKVVGILNRQIFIYLCVQGKLPCVTSKRLGHFNLHYMGIYCLNMLI